MTHSSAVSPSAVLDTDRRDGRDPTLLERLERLDVATVSDCLDQVGVRDHVLATAVRPLTPGSRLAGFAATVHIVAVDGPPADPADAYKNELAAVDALQPGDVLVAAGVRESFWGELLTVAAQRRGARGVVADAYTRDSAAIEQLGFATFVLGMQAQDSLGRLEVDAFGTRIECAGVEVEPGDLVLADGDGVVVVPHALALEVLERAERKTALEGEMRADLAAGMPVSEAFRRYGIL